MWEWETKWNTQSRCKSVSNRLQQPKQSQATWQPRTRLLRPIGFHESEVHKMFPNQIRLSMKTSLYLLLHTHSYPFYCHFHDFCNCYFYYHQVLNRGAEVLATRQSRPVRRVAPARDHIPQKAIGQRLPPPFAVWLSRRARMSPSAEVCRSQISSPLKHRVPTFLFPVTNVHTRYHTY